MRISDVCLKNYKRFKFLAIDEIPASAKLIVMLGPNGSGKSCVFDAFLTKSRPPGRNNALRGSHSEYYIHDEQAFSGSRNTYGVSQNVDINFHDFNPSNDDWHRIFHIRSPYRNEPDFDVTSIEHPASSAESLRFQRIIDTDAAV